MDRIGAGRNCAGAPCLSMSSRRSRKISRLVRNRDRVVSKDGLYSVACNGRLVSGAALSSRINAARRAGGDEGDWERRPVAQYWLDLPRGMRIEIRPVTTSWPRPRLAQPVASARCGPRRQAATPVHLA
ncbi:hypothetical protein HB662_15560 [Roseomonas frigidaquae]|uniref:Uncharacterized protein n=1 Tax=Falsiroseomonas frigidaquae TaxID=487318 RepID=A0ABX1F1L6_9PROT|nr:hypothetical protein [Falsiroseomonas frigidaquae]NKE46203.1 hypothetical protein [Falsiroseomonas frigidaquae]